MQKIIIHWTAGNYFPSDYEKKHYHFLVDKDGNIHNGYYKPEDNSDCTDGKYAKHTGGGNTKAIGIALCSMAGFKSPKELGQFPITAKQFEATMHRCALLCIKYKIKVTPDTVMTHYEFGLKHPKSSSAGKIDIIYLPPYPWVTQKDIGSFIRSKIKWYKMKEEKNITD